MQAVILHAEGDEIVAAAIAAKIAPAAAICARLRPSSTLRGTDNVVFAVWSARADADALGQALSRVATRADGHCIVVRADGTPLPPLPTRAQILTSSSTQGEFGYALASARTEAPTIPAPRSRPARARAAIGNWTPGVSIGLAIYAGMFVMAGAWRSEEVTEAIETGKAVPLASALHSFQTAAVASVDRLQIALAPSVPTARFTPPQRVILTGALDTSSIPVLAEAPTLRAESADDATPAPIRLHPIEASLGVPAAYTPGDTAVAASALSALDLRDTLPDVGAAEF